MNKRGRPAKEDAKRGQYRLRTGVKEEKMLDYLVEITGKNKAEIFREALRMLYNLEKTKHYLDSQ